MHAIEVCRTAVLGGHVYQGDRCGHRRISYNSCGNRHCPKCQSLSKAKWLATPKPIRLSLHPGATRPVPSKSSPEGEVAKPLEYVECNVNAGVPRVVHVIGAPNIVDINVEVVFKKANCVGSGLLYRVIIS
jgi:hypothetical protein